MRASLLAMSLGIAATGACAEEAPQPQPVAPGGVIAAAKSNNSAVASVVASPIVMQTTATRMPDGSIRYDCAQAVNPHPAQIRVLRPVPERQQ